MKTIIVLVLIIVLLVIIKQVFYHREDTELVVALYNEDTKWLSDPRFKNMSIVVYNKGPNTINQCKENCRIIKLENEGREQHTYLKHIVDNYNDLAPVTVFLQGSWQHPEKDYIVNNVLTEVSKTNDTVVPHWPVPDDINDFKIDEWLSTHAKNASMNSSLKLKPAPQRPFGEWYKTNFPGSQLNGVCYKGIFAASRADIQKHPVSFYEKFLSQLEGHTNHEVGHYMERVWTTILDPESKSKIRYPV